MTDPLIELARKSVPTEWCRNDIVLNAAVDAMKAQQAMIVEWGMREALNNPDVIDLIKQIEQDAYLKGRG